MSTPIIGIAANQLIHAAKAFNGNQVSYTPQGFVNAVQTAGGLPLLLPINTSEAAAQYVQQIDKLLLAGGQDVDPQRYGAAPHPKLGEINPARDQFEAALITAALQQQKPIFAVCRGMQLLNVVLGGDLYQDLSLYEKWQIKHEQQPTAPWFASHQVTIAEGSRLSFLPQEYHVNSYHHQALRSLAAPLKAVAWAGDGVVEAVESLDPQQRLLGVQWHPELTHQQEPFEQKIFDYFVQQL